MDFLSKLDSGDIKFSKSQRKIADYIIHNYNKVAYMKAEKLAEAVGVSEPTVIRFAVELGFSGYPEMKKAIQSLIRSRLTSVERIDVAEEFFYSDSVLKRVMSDDMSKLQDTLLEQDEEMFSKAVDAVSNSQHLYILGMRSSYSLATFMGFYMNYLKDNVTVLNAQGSLGLVEQLRKIGPSDTLFCISFPRYTAGSLHAASFAKDRGANIVVLTDNKSSPFAKIGNTVLFAKCDMVSFVDSLVAPLSLINAIVLGVAEKNKEQLKENFEDLEKLWKENDIFTKIDD